MRLALILLIISAASLFAEVKFESREWRSSGASRTPIAFRAAGIYTDTDVQVRVSRDGVHWSEWQRAHVHEEGELLFFGDPHHYLETSAPVRVLLIDPGVTERAVAKLAVRSAVDAPAVVKREDWGCTAQACPSRGAPSFTTVTHLIVHHSAGNNNAADWAAVVRAIWVLHVQGNGWNDVGYNYLIDPNGVLYEGRAGGDGVLGAHFSGVNTGTMGVCLIGTYSVLAPRAGSIDTLRALLAWQAQKWRIDPGGRSVHTASGLLLNNISGHRDAGLSPRASGATECPGNGVYALLPQIRRQVRSTVEGECALKIEKPNRCVGSDMGSLSLAAEIAPGCELNVQSRHDWITASLDGSTLRLEVAANSGNARSGVVTLNGQRIDVHQAASGRAAQPCVDFDGVVNGASFDDRPLAPNGLFTIFGANFAAEEAKAEGASWPAQLGGISVTVNDRAVPIAFVSPGQINAQLPVVNIGSARIAVRSGDAVSPERLIWVTEASPAVFAAIVEEAGLLSIYYTGGGRNTPAPAATIGEGNAERVSVDAAAGLIGVQRAVFRMPEGAAPDAEVTISVAGVTSPPVRITQ